MLGGNQTVEIIPHRLYWFCDKNPPNKPRMHSFTIDDVSFI